MINMLPIILIYVLFFVAVLAVFYFLSKIKIKKLGYWLLAAYTLFLIGCIIVYTLIPIEELPSKAELEGEEIRADIMQQVAYNGKSIEEFEKYKTKEWEFDGFPKDSLALHVEAEPYHLPLLIEEVPDAVDVRVVLYYVEPKLELEPLYGVSTPMSVYMQNEGELVFTPPSPLMFNYSVLSKEFPFTQLSNSKPEQLFDPHIYVGEHVLYMEVPENQELMIGSNINYEYID